ncbi:MULTISPECIES: hypothetical protein [Bacillus cereus group]|uniref:hypothetical protein n=1 Tax=Bacillus cereus group TaxID=86661 RepID=UPI00187A6761|nr:MULTISPECIES: hypothetical protein [Bacillus cereus group]MBE7145041.1 hypothetical protein [Bacillus paranthracis]MCU5212881.1 hypothetical protein [Bacillus paranthracis]MDA2593630.1 hypothetical protein [Bacillus cereus group sp. Bc065]HDR7527010.1 hypothetical protein [Bacillus paranthracis]
MSKLVIGSTSSGKEKDFSVLFKILIKEQKNLVVIDPLDKLKHLYPNKEKQGYRIIRYVLEKEDVLQQVEMDLLNSIKEKVLIHVSFPKTFFNNKENNSHLVLEFLSIVKRNKGIEWEKKDSLELFLMEYEGYASSQLNNFLGT